MPLLNAGGAGQAAQMPFPEDEYRLKVLNIVVQAKQNPTEEDVEKGNVEYLRWTFEVSDGEFAGTQFTDNSSLSFGPRSKTRKWVSALEGRKLGPTEGVDTDTLIGKEMLADIIASKKSEDRVYPKIDEVARVRG